MNCPSLEFDGGMFIGGNAFVIASAVHTRHLQLKNDSARFNATCARASKTVPIGSPATVAASGVGEGAGPVSVLAGSPHAASKEICAASAPTPGPAPDLALVTDSAPHVDGVLLSAGKILEPRDPIPAAASGELMELVLASGGPQPASGDSQEPEPPAAGDWVGRVPAAAATRPEQAANCKSCSDIPVASIDLAGPELTRMPALVPAAAVKRTLLERTPEQAADMKALVEELKARPWWPGTAEDVKDLAVSGAGLITPSDLGPSEVAVADFSAAELAAATARAAEAQNDSDDAVVGSESGSSQSGHESSDDGISDDKASVCSPGRAHAQRVLMVDRGVNKDSYRRVSEDLLIWLLSSTKFQLQAMNSILGRDECEPTIEAVLEIACGGAHASLLIPFNTSSPVFLNAICWYAIPMCIKSVDRPGGFANSCIFCAFKKDLRASTRIASRCTLHNAILKHLLTFVLC